jgi:hypothetical protein
MRIDLQCLPGDDAAHLGSTEPSPGRLRRRAKRNDMSTPSRAPAVDGGCAIATCHPASRRPVGLLAHGSPTGTMLTMPPPGARGLY